MRLLTSLPDPALASLLARASNPMAVLREDGTAMAANDAFRALPGLDALLGDPAAHGARVETIDGLPGLRLVSLDAPAGAPADTVPDAGTGADPDPAADRARGAVEARASADLRPVLDTLSAFVGLLTPDGIVVDANRAPLERAGLTLDQVIGRPFAETYWWSWSPEVQDQLRAAIRDAAAGTARRYDVAVRLRGGEMATIDFQIVPLRDETGRVTHLIPSAVDVTGRVEAQEALREADLRLRNALEAARAGAFEANLGTGRVIASEGMTRLFGLPDATGDQGRFLERVHPEDLPGLRETFQGAIGAGSRVEHEFRVLHSGGEVRWLAIRAEPGSGSDGAGDRLVGTVMDVTERRAIEADLREREERFRATFDVAAVGLAHVGLDGRWIRVNDRLCEIVGYPREELLQLTFAEITHPDDVAVDLALAQQLVDGRRDAYSMEKRYIRRDGSIAWVTLEGSVVRDPGGEPRYFVAAVRDITARREAEATIRRQLAEIEAIYRNNPVGLAVLDSGLRFIRINERLAEINGMSVDEHLGRTVREVVPGLADEVEPVFRRILETGEAVVGIEISGETRAQPGVQRTWLESWVPVRSRNDEVIGISITAEEITERRKVERLRDTFIGMLSHELRTPITSLYAASQLLRKERSQARDAREDDLVEEVVAGAERLHRIVENLLVLARVERGVALPGSDPVLLQRVLPSVLAGERVLWPEHRIELAPLPPDLPPIRSDADALAQVLRNLVSNAGKYGAPGGRIEVVVERPADDFVTVRVLDDGPGLGSVEPDRLFDLYYRAAEASRRAAGAGIGLFVSRALVEAMGGTLSASNRPEGGAEFRACLPVFTEE